MLKAIKSFLVSAVTIAVATQSAFADDVKDFLSNFDFNTGRVLIVAPEGVQPSSDWYIQFKADFGSRQALSPQIVIDYASSKTNTHVLPQNITQNDNVYLLAVKPSLSLEAAQTRTDFVSLSEMDVADELDINMQLAASFKIEDDKQEAVCATKKAPTPVDVYIQPSEGADWQRLADMENLWKFGFFLRSAINSACPTI